MPTPPIKTSQAPRLSVVVPAHDEADSIRGLLDEIDAALADLGPFEIIVVDDGSTDDMAKVLEAAGQARPWLTVVTHAGNFGQSAAMLSGVRAAEAPWIATLDGDGQNDPADIPGLWRMLQETSGDSLKMIAGHRRRRHDTWLRRASSAIANRVRGALLGDDTPDGGGGLKLIERETILDLPYFDHFHRFLPALVQRAGGEVRSVEVRHRPRVGGKSHYGVGNRLWVGIIDLLGVLWLQRRGRQPRVTPTQASRPAATDANPSETTEKRRNAR